MNWKCFLLGHSIDTWEIISEKEGTYSTKCARCGRIKNEQNYKLVEMAAMHKRDSMQKLAWKTLEAILPETFYKEPGKTQHCLSYKPNGQTVFVIDLGEHPIRILEIYKESLCKIEPEFSKWDIRPLLKLVKD